MRNKGYTGSYSTVCRVCRGNGITLPKKRKSNRLTEADKEAQKSENRIKQDFTAEKPNEKWLSDITEVPCSNGKRYVSPVLDCFDGAIVGLTMDDNMRKELRISASEQACRRQNAYSPLVYRNMYCSQRQSVA